MIVKGEKNETTTETTSRETFKGRIIPVRGIGKKWPVLEAGGRLLLRGGGGGYHRARKKKGRSKRKPRLTVTTIGVRIKKKASRVRGRESPFGGGGPEETVSN